MRKLAALIFTATILLAGCTGISSVAQAATTTATLTITPTTTLAAETSNNTSAANTFAGQSNGNLKASNVSKVSLKSVMYPGFSGKMYVHLMAWFGGSNHVNVGYQSDTATQVQRQVNDMMSRGVDGAIVDYYGPNNSRSNNTTLLLRDEAAKHTGFQFAVMEDGGALQGCAKTAGCDLTSQLISDLTYIHDNFQNSSHYITANGRPIVLFFNVERYGKIDWTRVKSSVPGNPMLIEQNSSGFTYTASSGSFAWVMINSSNRNDIETSYLDGFYSTGLKYPAELTLGTAYKGFNDTIASWSANRVMNQNCGQTWLATMAETAKYYSTTKQLASMQIATWNDYEEGTEIESGIDNCVGISASASGAQLNWNITGNEKTVYQYTVFVSKDGQNLMKLADVASGTHTLNVANYGLASGTYTFYVKAVGQPAMLNHMSGAVTTSISGSDPAPSNTTTGSVSIASPTSNWTGNATSSVHVVANAVGTANRPITAMRVYVDNASMYAVSAANVDTYLKLAAGAHSVVVQAWDNAGYVYKTPVSITLK